jgi:HAD superfamily hydrolase (TIGR01509 family)
MRPIHVFFDNDGTIVDSEILAVRNMLRHLANMGVEMDERVYAQRFPGLLERDIFAILEREHGLFIPEDFHLQLQQEHIALFEQELKPIKGMDTLFREVRGAKSMVSNGSVAHVERCLGKVGLLHDFEGQIFSAKQVDRPKPYPDVYLHALRSVGLDARQALVVEDSPTGIEAAKAAGLQVVGFLGASHITEGHDQELLARGADFLAADAVELRVIFAQLELI